VPTEWGGDHQESVVRSHLEVVQLDAAGNLCHVTASSDQFDTIDSNTHHYNIPYHLANVPVRTDCGSRRLIVRVSMDWLSGSPVKIDGPGHDPEQEQTSAFIVGSTDAVPPPPPAQVTVPDVLSFDETSAINSIQAAGLTLGTESHINNCVDP